MLRSAPSQNAVFRSLPTASQNTAFWTLPCGPSNRKPASLSSLHSPVFDSSSSATGKWHLGHNSSSASQPWHAQFCQMPLALASNSSLRLLLRKLESVEDLTHQARMVQAQLTDVHQRLSYWNNPGRIMLTILFKWKNLLGNQSVKYVCRRKIWGNTNYCHLNALNRKRWFY